MVVTDISNNIRRADVPFFVIKSDGTGDPANTENISIVVRYIEGCNVREDVMPMPTSRELGADAIAAAIVRSLQDCELDTKYMLSQCYNGASVMSGQYGGMRKKIEDKVERAVHYVHCFNHQVRLVVPAIGKREDVEKFFWYL